jgi:hypothetical protein
MKNVTGKVLVPFTYKGEDYKEGDEITLPALIMPADTKSWIISS